MTANWEDLAICRQEDPDLFFPIGNTGPALLQIEEAKAVCRRCPVINDCRTAALAREGDAKGKNRHGVYGALDPDERADIWAREIAAA